jgi:dTDP-L-rhamnose 4-epimerase
MYQIAEYTSVNGEGTAILLEALAQNPVERLVVASSMSIYGEGLYETLSREVVPHAERTLDRLTAGKWEPTAPDGSALEPIPTPETKPPSLKSVYALTKYDEERLCLIVGEAYRIPTVAMRFFNVYGPRQALSNPYTGVLAIFASRLLNRRPPIIYEDGRQRRDFVSVYDVARALRFALEVPGAAGQSFNVGSGQSASVREIADISRARTVLRYEPKITLDAGLMELAGWLSGQSARDRVAEANAELASRGLTV